MFLRVAGRSEEEQGRRDDWTKHEALADRQVLRRREAVGEDVQTDEAQEDKEQAGENVHEKLQRLVWLSGKLTYIVYTKYIICQAFFV